MASDPYQHRALDELDDDHVLSRRLKSPIFLTRTRILATEVGYAPVSAFSSKPWDFSSCAKVA
jgi:hypothetical protein